MRAVVLWVCLLYLNMNDYRAPVVPQKPIHATYSGSYSRNRPAILVDRLIKVRCARMYERHSPSSLDRDFSYPSTNGVCLVSGMSFRLVSVASLVSYL